MFNTEGFFWLLLLPMSFSLFLLNLIKELTLLEEIQQTRSSGSGTNTTTGEHLSFFRLGNSYLKKDAFGFIYLT